VLFIVMLLYCGTGITQTNFVSLTSSDFIKGLDDKDYLKRKLIENGYTIVEKSGSKTLNEYYEYWQASSLLYVDLIYKQGKKSTVKVGVHESLSGVPERLIKSFPYKTNEEKEKHLETVNLSPTNKKISYSLVYSRDTDNVVVVIWYDKPFYFFQYNSEKKIE